MSLSLGFGLLMLIGKVTAWWITGSAAILSDALESIVHVIAVAFAVFSLWLSQRTAADDRFPYGYERITFFSAGFEGAMIVPPPSPSSSRPSTSGSTVSSHRSLGTGALLITPARPSTALSAST